MGGAASGTRIRPGTENEIDLEHVVVRMLHSERGVGRLRVAVFAFDIEPNPRDVSARTGHAKKLGVEGAVDAFAPSHGPHVHGLDPEKGPVSPVAPFVGDHELTDHVRGGLALRGFGRDQVEALRRVLEHGRYARLEASKVEGFAFGLLRHRGVSVDEGGEMRAVSYLDADACSDVGRFHVEAPCRLGPRCPLAPDAALP